MAKYYEFPQNEKDCSFTYFRGQDGPNGFICFYQNASCCRTDPLEAWRTLGVAKFTDFGKALKAWCLEMDEKYSKEQKEEKGRPDQSFAAPDPEEPESS